MGCFELTWVPQGLLFVGDRTTGDAPLEYQLSEPSEGQDACLGPLDAISALDYATTRAEVRQRFARKLLRDRRTIDAALDEGRPSPDGRFTVGSVNLGGTYNNEQVVIRERGLPERRYPAGYFTRPDDYAWLDERTVLYRVRQPTGDVEFHSLDALTGTKRLLAEIPAAAPSRVAEFGVGARDRFWYRTEDGQRHEVPVGAGK
jgi:hypothetical protein